MTTRVLDSWAILEWVQGRDPARQLVSALMTDAEQGRTRLLMSAVNAGEVYYIIRKQYSVALAESWRDSAPALPVTMEVPAIDDIWDAATLKSRYPISYADAFAAA